MTPEQLSDKLIEAGLLNHEQVRACCESAGLTLEAVAAETLAKRLVKDGCLTLFQAQMAINGKASSLVIGSYVVLEKLGQGGMGQVFKARHKTMKREVALKVISPNVVKDETSLRRFQREVEAAAQLNHPNIVTAHDAGEFKGTHFLVMEYIKGKDLSSLVKTSGPLNAGKAAGLILQVASGLAYAHRNGIVHRDIKPANLLLDESGTVKILDMGLARFDAAAQDHASVAGLTGTGMLMGTVDYMSPEQAMDSKTADARSDIYSLGCTLHYLLTGKAVYEEDTVVKRLMSHQSAALPQLPILDHSLQQIFERTIAKKPEQRYGSCDQLSDDLQRWLDSFRAEGVKATQEMPLGGADDSFSQGTRPEHTKSGRAASGPAATGTRKQSVVLPANAEKPSDTTPSSAAMEQTVVPGKATTSGKVNTTRTTPTNSSTKTPTESAQRAIIAAETTSTPASRRATRIALGQRRPNVAAKSSHLKTWLLYGGLGCGAVLLAFLAATVFRVKTPIGTIVIETSQPEIAGAVISVDETQQITLETGDGAEPIEIKADEQEHTLKVTKGGFETFTQTFSVKAGDSQTITVRLEPLDSKDAASSDKGMRSNTKPDMPLAAQPPVSSAQMPSPASEVEVDAPNLPPIDYAAERKAAEWLLSLKKVPLVILKLEDGTFARLNPDVLDSTVKFDIHSIQTDMSRIDDDGMANLADCTRLSSLQIREPLVTLAGLKHLQKSITLEHLGLGDTAVNDDVATMLSQWPLLASLQLNGALLTDACLRRMPSLPKLKFLSVEGPAISDAGLASAATIMPNLERLNIFQDKTGPRSGNCLQHFPNLMTIECHPAQLTDEAIAIAKSHSKFQGVYVRGAVTDTDIRRLANLKDHLKRLEVFTASIMDPPGPDRYEPLIHCMSLEDLNLLGNQGSPTDDDMRLFAALPKLQRVTLRFPETSSAPEAPDAKRKYTAAGIEAFRKLRPDVDLEVDGTLFPHTADPGTVPIPPPPTLSAPELSTPAESAPSLAGTLAPRELRMDEGSATRPPFSMKIKSGDPLGEFAVVSRPAKIDGLLSWSIEPLAHRDRVSTVDVSSKGQIATGGYDGTVRLWSEDWQLIKVLPGHSNEILSVAFSSDGKQLATVARDPRANVLMWDVQSGQMLWSKPVVNWGGRLAWAPDSTRLTVCEPNRVLMLDSSTGNQVGELTVGGSLIKAAWSSNGRQLCVINDVDRLIRVVDATSMKVTNEFNFVRSADVAWSSDGHWLAIAGEERLGIFDARTFGSRHNIDVRSFGLAFSPDSTRLTVSHGDGTSVFSVQDLSETSREVGGQGESGAVSWSHDGKWFASTMFRYDGTTGKRRNDHMPKMPRTTAGPSWDGSRVATSSSNSLRIWNGDDGRLLREIPIHASDEAVLPKARTDQLIWNSAGTRLLRVGTRAGSENSGLEVIDPETGKLLHLLIGHEGNVWRTCWSKSGKLAASVGEDGLCIIWDTESGQRVRSMSHSEPQWWVQWSDDETTIACGSQTVITVWDAEKGEMKRAFKTLSERMFEPRQSGGADAPFSFYNDSARLTVLAKENGFELLDVKTGQISPLGSVTGQGRTSRFTSDWTPDGRILSAAGQNDVELFQPGSADSHTLRAFSSPHWLSDSRRIFGGDNSTAFISAFDTKSMRRLGVLLPELPAGEYIAIGPDGHYDGSPKCADQVVVVALHTNGSLKTYRLDEFAETFNWQNDPAKVRLLKLGK